MCAVAAGTSLGADAALADGSASAVTSDNEDTFAKFEAGVKTTLDELGKLLSTDDDNIVSTEVAKKMLVLASGVTAPGVPLPDLSSITLPTIDYLPVKKSVLTSRFGVRRDPINGRGKMHNGIDFSAKTGTPVRAAGSGVVIKAERKGGYGRVVYIDHGAGFVSRYAHLNSIEVKEGENVTSGVRIGTVGSSGRVTGPHLHFEIRVLGEAVDPAPFLGVKTRSFGERLRDLLTLPARKFQKPAKRAKTRG